MHRSAPHVGRPTIRPTMLHLTAPLFHTVPFSGSGVAQVKFRFSCANLRARRRVDRRKDRRTSGGRRGTAITLSCCSSEVAQRSCLSLPCQLDGKRKRTLSPPKSDLHPQLHGAVAVDERLLAKVWKVSVASSVGRPTASGARGGFTPGTYSSVVEKQCSATVHAIGCSRPSQA